MTQILDGMPSNVADVAPEGTGIVGNRHLVAVQTFDIARLTTHPVPLVPGTFVVVTGQGPKGDSNGSGKTSFESAVSLLLADAQWRLEANGSYVAAGLLFKPESAGLDPEHRYAPADHGYVVGVFADPACPAETALTVWVRIRVASPYVKARWTYGLHVATADTDRERYEQADRLWDALPTANEIGPRTLARQLYGDAPRCMAYLDTPLRKSGPSLLSQQMTEMNPDRIGEALIELTGRQGLLEREEEQRALLAEQKAGLTDKEATDFRARVDEKTDLDAVRQRDMARGHLAEGEHMWRLHHAKGYLEVLDQDEGLATAIDGLLDQGQAAESAWKIALGKVKEFQTRTDFAEREAAAKSAVDAQSEALNGAIVDRSRIGDQMAGLANRRAKILPLCDAWTGVPVEDAQVVLDAATRERDMRAAATLVVKDQWDAAGRALEQIRAGGGGRAGETITTLAAAGIRAVALLDVISLDDEARPVWEPRLWPHRDTVVIAPADEARAATTLAGQPGVTVVLGDGPLDQPAVLPTGVIANAPVAGLLMTLAERMEHRSNPDRAVDTALNEIVTGGFPERIAGRAARIAAAEARLAELEDSLAEVREHEQLARLAADAAQEEVDAAKAIVELTEITEEKVLCEERAATLDAEVARLRDHVDHAQQRWIDAATVLNSHQQLIQLAQNDADRRKSEHASLSKAIETKRSERRDLNVVYWTQSWRGTRQSAEALLATQNEHLREATARTLRRRAADALNDALNAYLGGATDIPPDLQEARRRREQLRDGFGGVSGDSVDFTTVARPLRDLLDARLEADRVLEDRIIRSQAERTTQIEAMRHETEQLGTDLTKLQDAISARIEASLKKISSALDRLNRGRGGFGAELKVTDTRPETPISPWKWEVTPRWRRSRSGNLVSYKEIANGAQVKQIAIQLVLAALLAADGAHGRVLILDELGNSLGDVNRKDVLRDLHEVAAQQNVTILGTCQDSVLADAAGVCGEILWFAHQSHSDPYNQPTRMWAYDDNGARVELVRDWLTAGRHLA